MYIKYFAATFIFFFLYSSAKSQEDCGNEYFEIQAKLYPEYWNEIQQLKTNANPEIQKTTDGEIIIPIVVHVLHLGEAIGTGSNISDAQILGAIQRANEEWNKTTGNGVNMKVQFCLAKYTPDGLPSTGINRIDASGIPKYKDLGMSYLGVDGANEQALKQLSNWNHNYVYNIWVIHKIAGGNWAGFAYFPSISNFTVDGTVIQANSMRSSSTTLPHELGHGLGLYHTFEGSNNGCPNNTNCKINGDWVCDTPPHRKDDCSSTTCTTDGNIFRSFSNIMSYCGGRNIFTQGQKDRVNEQLSGTIRKNLLNSNACYRPCDTIKTNLQTFTCIENEIDTTIRVFTALNGCDSIVTEYIVFIPQAQVSISVDSISLPGRIIFNSSSQFVDSLQLSWFYNDSLVATGNSWSMSTSELQNFTIQLKGENACGGDSVSLKIEIAVNTGLWYRQHFKSVSIFPNPGKSPIQIHMKADQKQQYSFKIMNTLGQEVLEGKLLSTDLQTLDIPENLPTGMFHFILFENNIPVANVKIHMQ